MVSRAVDATHVYWVNAGSLGGVYRVSKSGGETTTLYEGPIDNVESFGLTSDEVFFPQMTAAASIARICS